MTFPNPDAYREQAVSTASPQQLVLMLYDGALTAIARATLAKERGTDGIEIVNRELQRAQDIVTELYVTLDYDRGGAVARSLGSLYDFCLTRLVGANLTKRLDELEPVVSVLADLRAAWEQACCAPMAAASG